MPAWVPDMQGLGPVLLLGAPPHTHQVLGSTKPTMAASVTFASVNSQRLKEGDAIQ